MGETKHSPYRRYYDLTAGLLLIIILTDLGIIGYRKFFPAVLKIDRSNLVNISRQVDPNLATAFDLQCLPGINKKQAQALIEYRDEYQRRFPGRIAFTGPENLKRIKGISSTKILQLIPYLTFPKPVTQPRPNSP